MYDAHQWIFLDVAELQHCSQLLATYIVVVTATVYSLYLDSFRHLVSPQPTRLFSCWTSFKNSLPIMSKKKSSRHFFKYHYAASLMYY